MECKKLKTGNMKNEARPHRRLVYTWHCSKKCEKLQPFSSVVIKSAAVLCICWRSTVHNAISPAEQNHKCLPRGLVRSISMRGALLFPPTLHAFFAKHPKTRNNEAGNGCVSAEKKCETKHWNAVDESTQEILRGWTLIRRFLKGIHNSFVAVFDFSFLLSFCGTIRINRQKWYAKILLLNTRWNYE